jgi:hypothetical protein
VNERIFTLLVLVLVMFETYLALAILGIGLTVDLRLSDISKFEIPNCDYGYAFNTSSHSHSIFITCLSETNVVVLTAQLGYIPPQLQVNSGAFTRVRKYSLQKLT